MTEISTDTEVVAWLCEDLVMHSLSIIQDRKHAEARARRPGDWNVEPLIALASHQSALAQSAAENLEIAMQGLAAEGQAQEAYEKLTAARAEIERLTKERDELRREAGELVVAQYATTAAEARAKAAEQALEPFADAVFNDNGDMTIDYSAVDNDHFAGAYFTLRTARTFLSTLPASAAPAAPQQEQPVAWMIPDWGNVEGEFENGVAQQTGDYQFQKGPDGKWLFRCTEWLNISAILEPIVRPTIQKPVEVSEATCNASLQVGPVLADYATTEPSQVDLSTGGAFGMDRTVEHPMTTVQPAGDVGDLVDDLRRAASSARRQAESAIRMSGPTAVMGEAYALRSAADRHDKAADTIEALRSRLLAAEKAIEPFKRIADDIPSSFSDETVVSIGIDYTLSAEQVADIQGMSGGAIKSDRATIVLSMACMQASHFRAARSAINLIRGDE